MLNLRECKSKIRRTNYVYKLTKMKPYATKESNYKWTVKERALEMMGSSYAFNPSLITNDLCWAFHSKLSSLNFVETICDRRQTERQQYSNISKYHRTINLNFLSISIRWPWLEIKRSDAQLSTNLEDLINASLKGTYKRPAFTGTTHIHVRGGSNEQLNSCVCWYKHTFRSSSR